VPHVRVWFWGWLVACVALAVASAVARDRASAPFAVGAAAAAALEALGASPALEWAAFALVSAALYVAVNRRRYRGKHGPGAPREEGVQEEEDVSLAPYRPRHKRGAGRGDGR
jgi:membrane protein implicated in regulation of membrane protease activity